ncbi:MAG: hypothetical protein ACTSPQ_19400, partial [Candidatus Helarchaeota archaeon]
AVLATIYLFVKLWEFLAKWGLKLLASFAEAAKQALENAIKIIILVLAYIAVAFTYISLLFMEFTLILFLVSICLIYGAQLQLIGFISFNITKNNRIANFSIIIIWEYLPMVDLELPSLKISVESGEIKGEFITNLLLEHEKYEWNYIEENDQYQNNDTSAKTTIEVDPVSVGFLLSVLSGWIILGILSVYTPDNIYYYIALGAISITFCALLWIFGEQNVQNDPNNYGVFLGLGIGALFIAIISIIGGFLTLITKGIKHNIMEKLEKIITIIIIILSIIAAIIIGITFTWYQDIYPIIELLTNEIIPKFFEILLFMFNLISFIKIGKRSELSNWKSIGITLICIGGAYLVLAINSFLQYSYYKNC